MKTPLSLGIVFVSMAIVLMAGGVVFLATRTTGTNFSDDIVSPTRTETSSSSDDSEAETSTGNSTDEQVPTTSMVSTAGFPIIYVSIASHNEDTLSPNYPNYVEDTAAYETQREGVAAFAQMVAEHGASYNFQTDWNFLLALLKYDQGTESTNGKNLLRYLVEDLGMAVDPHSHEHLGYNYADVAYLISQLGVEPSGVVGGFIAAPSTDSDLTYLWGLRRGSKYPDYAWSPEILWGGGTGMHQNEEDLWISGIWKPASASQFDVHDADAPLPVVGHYLTSWEGLDQLLALQSAGELEAGKIYTVTIMNSQQSFTDAYIEDFAEHLEQYEDETADGRIIWATITETYDAWVNVYDAEPSILHWEGEASTSSSGFVTKPSANKCGDGICQGAFEAMLCPEDCP